jgi:hypothetical protein
VEFTAAMLLDEESNTKPAISKRLNEISCPGDVTDPIISPCLFAFLSFTFVFEYYTGTNV